MPKSRGSSTIGAAGGGGSVGAAGSNAAYHQGGGAGGGMGGGLSIEQTEMPGRVQDRLSEPMSIDVMIPSRTRGEIERTRVTLDPRTPGTAQVESQSGRAYQVNHEEDRCNCIHHRTTGSRCRHIQAVNTAVGQLTEMPQREMPGILTRENIGEALMGRVEVDRQDEENRRALTAEQEDDGFFYADNPEEFERELQRLRNEPLQYEYENALNGSRVTFGIELEFVGGNADAIARELYDLGICAHNRRMRYHSESVPGKWKLERDGSVSDGDSGGELVSPVLQDTPETWRTIEKICEVVKRHGGTVNQSCGGHVHIGLDPLDTARQRWRRFFKSISSFEECIYRFSGGDQGRIRGGYSSYATPFNERAALGADSSRFRVSMDDDDGIRRMATQISENRRYYGINLTNIPKENAPNTVEFRYFNGSLNPAQIQANVKLANGIITAAQKARTRDTDAEATSETMKRRGNMLRNLSIRSNNRDNSHMAKFLDIMFSRKKDKETILSVLAKNNWRPIY